MTLSCLPRVLNLELRRCGLMLSTPRIFTIQVATICSKEVKDPTIKKPAPWPYEHKQYTYLTAFIDSTTKRFDENSKIILVDGNIGAGKGEFARQLADAFDMKYVPEPTMDKTFITEYGYDLRELDSIVPAALQSCDLNTFYKNPNHHNVVKMQFTLLKYRMLDYVDALCHVLNTGQGVVMERSVYSDFVFFDALYKAGLFRKEVKTYYDSVIANSLDELMMPHLVIYLDVSPEVALQRIKAKNGVEAKSPIMTKEYLENIEYSYKQEFLRKMEPHSEILIYDWNNYGDVEVVVEDIERIDFDRFTKYDIKLKQWRKYEEWDWNMARRRYTMDKEQILGWMELFEPSLTELFPTTEDIKAYQEIIEKVPGEKYEPGFNEEMGDHVTFKLKDSYSYRHMYMKRT